MACPSQPTPFKNFNYSSWIPVFRIPGCGYRVRYQNAINYNKLYAGRCRFLGRDLNPHLQIKALHETFSFYRGSTAKNLRTESNCHQLSTVKLWYITKSLIVFTPEIVRYMKKDLDRTKRHYSKHVSPVPWVCVISRFQCKKLEVKFFYTFESVLYPKEILKTK